MKPIILFNVPALLILLTGLAMSSTFLHYPIHKSLVQSKSVLHIENVTTAPKQEQASPGLPERLKIPGINVDAAIEHVGLGPDGAMDVPKGSLDVAWFNLGPRPGEKGSAVISGHFDGKNGEAGIFAHLNKLKKGDKLYIENDNAITTTFVVREKRTYGAGYADDVFSRSDSAYLNLVTCDGVWDNAKKSYTKRLVVFADNTN